MLRWLTSLFLFITVAAQGQSPTPATPVPADTGRSVSLEETVITGTLRELSRARSVVATEVVSPQLFRRAAATNLLDGLSQVSGVQPMLACGVCYTGDIHLNGLEGAYTMVLIDGLPIVSGLGTVYGLFGIPSNLIQQIELVRGPGSALYGSEALAGVVNVRTVQPWRAPRLSLDLQGSSYGEVNLELGTAIRRRGVQGLISYAGYQHHGRWDANGDGFTDLPLVSRHSLFTKWNLDRPEGRAASVALRYYYEDRFGGQLGWRPTDRGGDRVYGESIFTHRLELMGNYALTQTGLPLTLSYSANWHTQNSVYGNLPYRAQQGIAFGQLVWDQALSERHHLLVGSTLRYSFYDDNTPATASDSVTTAPEHIVLPGLFAQHEWRLGARHSLLTGARLDHSSVHGSIASGRLNWKWDLADLTTLRVGAGNGFRVVNLFTEDHAALSGAREVVVTEDLQPERSWNVNAALTQIWPLQGAAGLLTLDVSAFYTHFSNQILPDYTTNPTQIIYANLDGYGRSTGGTMQLSLRTRGGLQASLGVTALDVARYEQGERRRQPLVAPLQGTFALGYTFTRLGLTIDYTGQFYAPMDLPVVPNDFRPSQSPWFTLQNVQLTQTLKAPRGSWQIYLALKNLWDFTPRDPLLRPFDPFDRTADDPVSNPNGYRFDTAYAFAPQQGRRLVLGLRYVLP